jgi:diguanylate cyclase (GGDEF)-like protein
MAAALHPESGEHFDSHYTAERRRIERNRPFSPGLEAEFIASRLIENRVLIRAGCGLALFIALARAVVQGAGGHAHGALLIELLCTVLSSALLVWLAWSAAFERRYLPWAQIIVPARNAVAAAHFAAYAAAGQIELLMIVPMMLIGPFFFSGLRYRAALVAGVLAVAGFGAAAALDMPHATALRCCLFMLVALVGSAYVAHHLEKGARAAFLERYLIAALAQRDALTGARNRRSFDEQLARLWQQAAESERAIAVFLIDVDHFKAYNDRYGHLAGDDALRSVARAVQDFARRTDDVFARYGGEEFVAILQDIDRERARDVAEQMRRAVAGLSIEHRASRTAGMVTISIGVAVIAPSPERDCRGALQLADQALYQAKLKGRNLVELKDDEEYRLLVTGVFPTVDNASGRRDAG